MHAKVISYSQVPLDEKDKTLLELVAYCARVSNPSNQDNHETAEKLVKYLTDHAHWSPLEMVSITLEVECTRDIARQMLRHRSFTFQEFSQRYADPTTDLSFTTKECRMQDHKNRQNSIEITHADGDRADILSSNWESMQRSIIRQTQQAYNWAIENGIAKEQARAVLPEGLTMSRLYVQGTLRSWFHYIQLRSGNGTQKEHIILAQECAKAIAEIYEGVL